MTTTHDCIWKDRFYEEQASNTERNGIICQERDRAIARAEKAEGLLADSIPKTRVREIFTNRLNLSYQQRAYSWHEIQDALSEVEAAK